MHHIAFDFPFLHHRAPEPETKCSLTVSAKVILLTNVIRIADVIHGIFHTTHVGEDDKSVVIYAIFESPMVSPIKNTTCIVFCDGRSEMSFISHKAAKTFPARTVEIMNLSLSTLTGS